MNFSMEFAYIAHTNPTQLASYGDLKTKKIIPKQYK